MKENSEISFIEKNYQEVGKLLRWTKQRYTWVYQINGIIKEVKFYNSVKSGKKLVLLDGNILYDNQVQITFAFIKIFKRNKKTIFFYEFTWDNYQFTIQQNQKSFDLIVKSLVQPLNKYSKFNYYNNEESNDDNQMLENNKLCKQEILEENYQYNQREEGDELKIKCNILKEQQPKQQFPKIQEQQMMKRKITSINQSMHQKEKENTQEQQQVQEKPTNQKDLLEMTEGVYYTPQDQILKIYEEETQQQKMLREQEANKDRLSVLNNIQFQPMGNQPGYQQNFYGWNQNSMYQSMQCSQQYPFFR